MSSFDYQADWDTTALLHRINPARNEFRFYHVRIGPTLLDKYAVIRVWGRIGGQQRTMINPCQTDAEARILVDRLIRRRLKRGYTLVRDKRSGDE